MPKWICEFCSIGFRRDRSGNRPIRFCSQSCYHKWRKENEITTGQFQSGTIPWNSGTKGIMKTNSGSFFKGQKSNNYLPIGSVTIRTTRRDAKKRAWVKISDPNIWKLRAVVVWEEKYGPVPKGCVIHHIDRNTLNDTISNLAIITRAAHMLEHRPEFEEKRCANLSRKRNSC